MSKTVGIVILAAGKGTRMKVDASKPMVPCLNKKLIDYPLSAAFDFLDKDGISGEITIVTGYKKEELEIYLEANYVAHNKKVSFAHQVEQIGTANALSTYFEKNKKSKSFDYTLVMCADTPLISESNLSSLYNELINEQLDGVAATCDVDDAKGYGRIIRHEKGFNIVEEKDANETEKRINEINAALYFLKTDFTVNQLQNIDSNNNSGEFYLTDLFQKDFKVKALKFTDYLAFLGVNSLAQLEDMEKVIRSRKVMRLSESGVRFIDRNAVFIDEDIEIGVGTVIYPNVYIEGGSIIGSNSIIEHGCVVRNSNIKDNVIIKANSYIVESVVGEGASIGPFAHLRPGANIGAQSKIGNFVEIKKSNLAKGVKVSHLSYVGDAEIGEDSNIGCGFITCNYDGANKHITKIGKGCFIGSDSQMIAPVEIGDECYVASGSTINKSMSDGSFAIARARQSTKEGLARKFIKKKS